MRYRHRQQKPEKRAKKKMEMSKKLLIAADTMTTATIILTFAAVFVTRDASPLAFLIPGVFGLSGVAHGFYFWKAKAENLHKYGRDDKITMSGGDDYSGSDGGSIG